MAAASLGAGLGLASTGLAWPDPPPDEPGIQVLTRGPAHEAFAETVSFDPQPGITVPRMPPDPIEELPPLHRPAGANVSWIPGYWAWDDEGNDFLWVSGIWRTLPPGRQWVAGYWAPSGKGAQWASGYWADAALTEAEYLPEAPPESAEAGPNVPSPSEDSIWLPGGWVWQDGRYAWRPGFWSAAQRNWVWVPSHYHWAPRGYVYVDGYWDHTLARRGVLFAPVSFRQNIYTQSGFSYTPSTVIDTGAFNTHLFLRPSYGHYYFGDYYGGSYASAGFYPWNVINTNRRGYDPLYAQQRWDHRRDMDWERNVEADFQRRRIDEGARPPRTYAQQEQLSRLSAPSRDPSLVYAQPFDRYAAAKNSFLRFQALKNEDQQRYRQLGQQVQAYRVERSKLETRGPAPAAGLPPRAIQPERIKLPRSPYIAGPVDELDNDFVPPKIQAFPKTDLSVVPKRRQPVKTGAAP